MNAATSRSRTKGSPAANDIGRSLVTFLKRPLRVADGLAVSLRSIHRHLSREDGFTLIEVMASALIVVLLSAAAAISLSGSAKSSYESRVKSDAQALAEQNQQYLRGLNVNELSNLNQTLAPVKMDGATFYVNERATYVSNSTNAASCTPPSIDYLQTTSTVTWTNMGTDQPVVDSSQLSPPLGSIAAGNGGLAVSVASTAGAIPGVNIQISGPSSASGTTDSAGCALFGDLPSGTYTITATPVSGAYVDQKTGAVVSSGVPDTTTAGVSGGGVTGVSFAIAAPGTITYSFKSSLPSSPTPPAAAAIGAVAYNNNMNANFFRLCTLANGANCPAVNQGDTSFPATDWPQLVGQTQITATQLYPMSGTYTVYGGVCSENAPDQYSGTDVTANVTSGGNTNATVNLPAMVIQVYSGTPSKKGSLVMPSHLYIKDTGCNVRYYGYPDSTPVASAPGVLQSQSPEQAVVPVNSNYLTSSTFGLLTYPAMPYGNYEVCVDQSTKGIGQGNGTFWGVSAPTNGDGTQNVTIYEGETSGSQTGPETVGVMNSSTAGEAIKC
jgi:prepilin-type N-terminal cleavage/methylation domain-containing protein